MDETKFCLGCGCQLKTWEKGEPLFCGAIEQCLPAYQLEVAIKALRYIADWDTGDAATTAEFALDKIDAGKYVKSA